LTSENLGDLRDVKKENNDLMSEFKKECFRKLKL